MRSRVLLTYDCERCLQVCKRLLQPLSSFFQVSLASITSSTQVSADIKILTVCSSKHIRKIAQDDMPILVLCRRSKPIDTPPGSSIVTVLNLDDSDLVSEDRFRALISTLRQLIDQVVVYRRLRGQRGE